MTSLAWDQVSAGRLARHGLMPRVGLTTAVQRLIGVQAQVMSAAELALWARVDGLRPADVQAALWQDRTLVKTWAMRGTLHLLTADDLPTVVAARQTRPYRYWIKNFAAYGVSESQYERFLAAVPQVLGDQPLTRAQLAAAAAEHTGVAQLRPALTESHWGSTLKPSAFRGDLCFGPSRGRNVTFVRPRDWLGRWREVDPPTALREVIVRYLDVYGPATPRDFGRWWGAGTALAKRAFHELTASGELAAVDVEGWQAFALRDSLASLEGRPPTGIVRLLPSFDPYTHGLIDCEPLLPQALRNLVFRPQGWVSAVVVLDGRIAGVWDRTSKARRTAVDVRMFSTPSRSVREAIVAEAERLHGFLDADIAVGVATLAP